MKVNKKNIQKGFKTLVKEGPTSLVRKLKGNNVIYSPIDLLSNIQFSVGKIDIVLETDKNIDDIFEQLNKNNIKFELFVRNNDDVQYKYAQRINDFTFNNVFKLRSFVYLYKQHECKFPNCFNINYDNDVIKNINDLDKDIKNFKIFANYNQNNNISVKTSTFFNYQGTNYYSGGAERYLLDLYEVCNNMNLNLNIYQHGEKAFFRKYNNINVIGLYSDNAPIDYSYSFIDKQTKNYIYHTYSNTNLHIYSAFQECYPNHIGPSIGISHGISWDNKTNHYSYGKDVFWENKKIYLDGATFCDKLISVDTNTPNWFQTIDYDLGNRKFHVIPNYVDNNEFKPRDNYLEKRDKIIITYPRRLYEPRGLYIVLDIVDEILKKYKNVEFHFVGKGFSEDIENIDKKIKKYPNRIKCYSKAPEKMKEVYKNSDISLIPTQYSEGTSLSCLEALSSGNLVIATRIGGLTDLVINGFNGYLIEPSAESLKETLLNVLDNFEAQNEIRKRGIESAKAFNKKAWQNKWQQEIRSFKIKEKSQNNELIEIYCNDINHLAKNTIKVIKEELIKGNLIYLRVDELSENDGISYGLLQVVATDEEVVSKAKKVYKEKTYKKAINRSEPIEII